MHPNKYLAQLGFIISLSVMDEGILFICKNVLTVFQTIIPHIKRAQEIRNHYVHV